MSYENGTIDEAIRFMNEKYDYYVIKNMHQLFIQITKEGSKIPCYIVPTDEELMIARDTYRLIG